MKSVIKPLANSVLIPLGLTASASTTNVIILITSNDEMKDIMKIVKPLEDSDLLLKRVSETIQNE